MIEMPSMKVPARAKWASIEAVVMMEPPPRASIAGIAAFIP